MDNGGKNEAFFTGLLNKTRKDKIFIVILAGILMMVIPMASMIPIQRSPLQHLVQGWIIQTRVREIPDISRRAGRSQRPVPGMESLILQHSVSASQENIL